jgi:hypothetical protein
MDLKEAPNWPWPPVKVEVAMFQRVRQELSMKVMIEIV